MIAAALSAATAASPWIGPAIVAAAVSGVVSLVTLGMNASGDRKERQRQLFAEAFATCQAYKEFPFRVRRRRSDAEAATDRARLTSELSDVQAKLNDLRARLRVEAPRVGEVFQDLMAETRRIAGAEIRRSWELPPADGDNVSITDIDLSAIDVAEDRFLLATSIHLSLLPAWVLLATSEVSARLRSAWAWLRTRARSKGSSCW